MSNFECEKCGTICYDTPSGYITGCEHYPADIKKREGEERETMTTENSTDDDSASSACYADGFQFGRELLDECVLDVMTHLRTAPVVLLVHAYTRIVRFMVSLHNVGIEGTND